MTDELHEATVCAPVAPLFAEPRVASAMISQLLSGRVVELLETRDDWFRVRGPDEYEGWLHRGYLALRPGDACRRVGPVRISLGCSTADEHGRRRVMPLGAWLADGEVVRDGIAIEQAERASHFPAEAGAITRTALARFEGTSYLWGGVTPWGADCSGLAQSVFALHGIQLRRDAWQQAEQGDEGEPEILDAKAADLLFFSDRIDRHITHVAIALGNRGLVHLALGRGGYAVEKLDDESDPYVEKLRDRFITARRILGAKTVGS